MHFTNIEYILDFCRHVDMKCHENTGHIQIHGIMVWVTARVRHIYVKGEYIRGTARLNVTQASYKDKDI